MAGSYTKTSMTYRTTSWRVGLTAAVCLLVTAIVTLFWIRERRVTETRIFNTAFEDIKLRLPAHLIVDHGLRGTRAMVQATGGMDQLTAQQFRIYAASRDVPREFPGTRGIALAKLLPQPDQSSALAKLQGKGWPVRSVKTLGPNSAARFVVIGTIPEAEGREIIGFDVASEPIRANVIGRAIRTGKTQVTAPHELIPLLGETAPGVAIFIPIFEGVTVPASEVERIKSARGVLFMTIKLNDRMDQFRWLRRSFDLKLEDVTLPGKPLLLYASGTGTTANGHFRSDKIEVAGRIWRLTVTTKPGFRAGLGLAPWWMISLIGVLLTCLATLAALIVDRTLRRISRLNRSLEHQAAVRQVELQEAREDALAAGRQFLAMIEENPQGIALVNAASRRVEQANPRFLELLPEAQIALKLFARYLQTPADKRADMAPFRIPGTQHHDRWIRFTCSPLDPGSPEATERYIVMVEDITVAHEQRLLLDEAMVRLNLATATAQIGVWYWNLVDNTVQWDKRMFEIFGRTPEEEATLETSYQFWLECVHPDDVAEAELALTNATSTGTDLACNYRIICANGDIRTIEAFAMHRRNERGQSIGMLGVCRDATERLHLEAELIEAHRDADAANKAKDQFLANISHELRTPMNAILGLLQVLEKGELDGRQRLHVTGAKRAANALLRILNDILDFSRIESGLLNLVSEPVSLTRVTDSALALYDEAAKRKGIRLTARIEGDPQRQYWGDELRIGQILNNFIDNALKFTSEGEVEIVVSHSRQSSKRDLVRFAVRDTGQGLGEVDVDRLFQPFIQAEPSITRLHGGSGLGLAICRQLAQAMGGAIGAENNPGKGSLFWFELPLVHGTDARLQQVRQLEPDRALIVSSQEDYGQLLLGQLNSLGLKADLLEASDELIPRLAEASKQGQPYDLLLLDLETRIDDLPLLISALHEAERVRAFPRASLIMLSSPEADLETTAQRTLMLMPDAALVKPVAALSLYEVLSDLQRNGFTDRPYARPGFDEPQFASILNSFAGAKILLVEDNATNQEVALALLDQLGFTADVVRNGQEAVERLESQDYAMVLMDIHMPVMNGLEATQAVRKGKRNAKTPIVAITAAAFSEDRRKAFQAGMSDFISKPIDLGRLAALLVKWLPRSVEQTKAAQRSNLAAGEERKGKGSSFDFLSLQHQLGGGHDRVKRVLGAFFEDFENWNEDADQAFRSSDYHGLGQLVHTLKGAASGVGAIRLLQSSKALDDELRSPMQDIDRKKVEVLLTSVSADLADAIQQLRSSAWIEVSAIDAHN